MNFRQRAWLAGPLVLWLAMFAHFWQLNCIYAAEDYHTAYPLLYVAIESWMLLCGVIVTILTYMILGDVKSE